MKERRERTVAELAQVVKGRVQGDPETVIRGIASIEEARNGDITFAESVRFLHNAEQSMATAILAPENAAVNGGKVMIQVANPRLAFAQLLDLFAPEQYARRGIDPTVVYGSDFRYGANVSIGANSVLGENVRLGENVTIHPLCYLGDDVEVGDNTVIGPQVTLLRGTIVGSNCILHSGTVLGADGFGYLTMQGKHRKIPQIGNVQVGNDVEIGANVTIDRARTGTTRVGNGTKIDNMVHIGHNCQIGEDCILVAQVGLAGGVEVGNHVIIAGQSGVKEQVKIGDRVVIGAQAGVMGDVPAGAFVSGYGPRAHKDTLKVNAALSFLPDLLRKVRDMERRLAGLEGKTVDAGPEETTVDEE
ncbi:MAG: UDP-3-O-(3-hydroxymyristoyl)glucosamine N-acyltransferase [Capsulimonadales bacterium]|nr:UDP-3-O-(3-hydroxymyristoyl)glucosamine N-acyltransferase [Capsulimonadales bacterium]